MSAWMQGLIGGFLLGTLFGLFTALVLVRLEARDRKRRPGFITTHSNVSNIRKPTTRNTGRGSL